jgi:outer membrane protein assembly factor BamB
VRTATGEEVWREKVGGNYYASPVCAGDRIYTVSTKGEVVVIAAADKYQLLARNQLGEKSLATPAIAGGRMFLRTYSHLISIGGK